MKILVITVAGSSTRFSKSIGKDCLKCIYTESDVKDTLLHRLLSINKGYDKFIRSMEEDLVGMLMRRRRATLLLTKLLSIKYPYSKVMYLYYYKNMKENEISQKFFMSRATFYRIKNIGVEMLTRMYYPSKPGTSAK